MLRAVLRGDARQRAGAHLAAAVGFAHAEHADQDPAGRVPAADAVVQHRPRPARAAPAAAAPGHPAAGRPGRPRAAVPDGPDPCRRSRPSGTWTFPARCWTSTGSGGRRRCSGRTGWSRPSDTPARIYYKYEGVSPAGSHKPNTAVPQAFYNAQAGSRRLTTETGAGQWGTALGVRLRPVRPGVRGLAGRRLLRPEALPPHDDGDVRRDGAPLAVRADRRRARGAGGAAAAPGLARASRSARRSRWPPATGRPGTRWAACSTTYCCTRA